LQHIRSSLQKIVGDVVRSAPAGAAPLMAWPLVCGAAVAKKTEACDFREGILRVRVPDGAWRAELASMEPQYLAGMNQVLPGRVRRIEFITAEEKKR